VKYTIKPGDSTLSLADRFGLFAETIWSDPANAELRQRRGDMNILLPGDVLEIRDKQPRFETRVTNQRHLFRRRGVPAKYRLQAFNGEKPRAFQRYLLLVDGAPHKGVTDKDGILEEMIPPVAKEGRLTIGPDLFEIPIRFGLLDPLTELIGVQKRLRNMGFLFTEPSGQPDEATSEALRLFQKRFGLQQTEEANDETRHMLEQMHDTPKLFPPPPLPGTES
jgi:hypothetical protein